MRKGNCKFSGTGGQYFATVFIHLFIISTITFGIYSAWAWVRLFKLKASHTLMNGNKVTFTGEGGRLFLLVLIQGLLTMITFGLYGPWAICKFFKWKAQHTYVGEKSSNFNGTGGSLFIFYLIHLIILPILTLGLYYFYGFYRLYAWKEEHTKYGGERTSFGAGFGGFIKVSLVGWILNTITLSLFTPWAFCMLYKWQVEGLVVGDKTSVEHFPPVKTKWFTVLLLIILVFLLLITIGMFIKDNFGKRMEDFTSSIQQGKIEAVPQKAKKHQILPSKKQPSEIASRPGNTIPQNGATRQTTPKVGGHNGKVGSQNAVDFDREMKTINDFIQKNGTNAIAFYNRAWLYASKNRFHQAVQDYSHAIKIDITLADAYYNRGLVYVMMKEFDQAFKDFSEVIRLNSSATDAYCNRGNVRFKQGRTELAIQDYSRAIELNPSDGDLYYNRGVVRLSQKQKANAIEDFKKAAEKGHQKAREYLGMSFPSTTKGKSATRTTGIHSNVGWKRDLIGVEIPQTPGQGRLHGRNFMIERASIQNGVLTLRQGKEFFADLEIMIFLFLNNNETPEGKMYKINDSSKNDVPHVHLKWKEDGRDIPEFEGFVKGYAMYLELGKQRNGKIPGKIYVCMPDDLKSYIAGTFKAEVI